MGLYRTFASIGALLGLNIAVKLFNVSFIENLVSGNLLAESIVIVGVIGLLSDLNILKADDKYLKLGIITLVFGAIWEILSFSSLFVSESRTFIFSEWIKIAPISIALIGIPILWIADKVKREKLILGFDSTKKAGLFMVMLFSGAYTVGAVYILNSVGLIL